MSAICRERWIYWDRFCKLQRFSFLIGNNNNVLKVNDDCGNFNDHYDVSALIDEMQSRIIELEDEIINNHFHSVKRNSNKGKL